MTEKLIKAGPGKIKKKRRNLKVDLKCNNFRNSNINTFFLRQIRGNRSEGRHYLMPDPSEQIIRYINDLDQPFESIQKEMNNDFIRITSLTGSDFMRLDNVVENIFKKSEVSITHIKHSKYYLIGKIKQYPNIHYAVLKIPSADYLEEIIPEKRFHASEKNKVSLLKQLSFKIKFKQGLEDPNKQNGLVIFQSCKASKLANKTGYLSWDDNHYSKYLDKPVSHVISTFYRDNKIYSHYLNGYYDTKTLEDGLRQSIMEISKEM